MNLIIRIILIVILISWIFLFNLCKVASNADKGIEEFLDDPLNSEIFEDME